MVVMFLVDFQSIGMIKKKKQNYLHICFLLCSINRTTWAIHCLRFDGVIVNSDVGNALDRFGMGLVAVVLVGVVAIVAESATSVAGSVDKTLMMMMIIMVFQYYLVLLFHPHHPMNISRLYQ